MLSNVLWLIIVLLVIGWLLGLFVFNLGSIIHLLLVVAVLILLYNLLTGRGARL